MSEAVQIGPAETLRLERTEAGGKQLVAARVFTAAAGDRTALLTPRGLVLRPRTWRKVLPALERLLQEVEETCGDDDAGDD
jgi:hypothetical protein